MLAYDARTVLTGPPSREAAITLARVCGQSFIAPVVAGVLAILVSLAYASPTDPTWIAGIYDNADYDDVVALLTDGTGASNGQGPARVEQGPVAYIPLSEPSLVPKGMLGAQKSRGPPVEPCDGSVNLRPKPATLPSGPRIPDVNRSPSDPCQFVGTSNLNSPSST